MRVIAGKYKRTPIQTLEGDDITRPTKDMVKEALFSSIEIYSDTIFLDLFSGSGSIGIEALSNGENYLRDHNIEEAIELLRMANLEMNGTYNRVVGSVQSNSNISVGQARQNAIGTLERRLDALSESLETYSSMVASGRSVNVTLQGDAKTMFKAIQRENNIYRTSTGRSVFA